MEYNVLSVKNPTKEDFRFKWDGVWYEILAGKSLALPQFLADFASLKLAKKMAIAKHGGKLRGTRDKAYIAEALGKILSKTISAEPNKKSSGEKTKAEIEALNKVEINKDAIPDQFEDEGKEKAPTKEELMKENNPIGARAEELNKMNKTELTTIAVDICGLKIGGEKKLEIIDAILNKEKASLK